MIRRIFKSGRQAVIVTRPEIEVELGSQAPRELRIALLSDFHYDPWDEAEFLERCVELTNLEAPNLTLCLGDFVSYRAEKAPEVAGILGKLTASGGVFGVLGNHDHLAGAESVKTAVEEAGIPILANETRRLPVRGGTLALGGLDSCWGGAPDASELTTEGDERLILAHHEPDHIVNLPSEVRKRVAIQVSGHTHGGQICAPGGIVLARVYKGMRYTKGHYRLNGGTHLYVNRGIGTVTLPIRMFCPPEITVLTVKNRSRTG